MKSVLFVCTRNSCRSQMAEGWARHLHGAWLEPASAGSEPYRVDPLAIEVMAEVGIDIAGQRSKSVEEFRGASVEHVFTLCSDARESCPLWLGEGVVVHHGFDDPQRLVGAASTEDETLACYRRVRDEIGAWVRTAIGDLNRG